ncbi:outer membrane receptor protein involved in Fe transport [Pseudoduganella lurida]|uniref:Outer membrane receptor protein involved in Fe transport n=1 Tax=Pseudoduganella lurida TaxID=1036180 RepID=A0A562R0Q4_9BURK|nr:TonB-dependent receptor [Pseudoduganella lurida]TWI62617.1 outer membrane receptor protein involved in Fe transport [Pseudoduganella lurida]
MPSPSTLHIGTVLAGGLLVAWPAVRAVAQETPALPVVEVVGTTPLPGLGLPPGQIPANVQTLDGVAVTATTGASLPDALNRRVGSVFVNEVQGNPFQPDLNFRGFTASPLLGTPQGLSVYVDGVRFNQPFGDVVSWDLIPRAAIASLALMPGSNPLFGLNTLGGAFSIRTRDGMRDPGTSAQLLAGRHDRQELVFEHGGNGAAAGRRAGWHWYVTGNGFREDGWRAASPTRLGQLFGKVGWLDGRTDVALSAALARTRLTGNGLQEGRLLERDRASVYTTPDQTRNRSLLLNLVASHAVSDAVQFSGNAYYRRIRTATLNGDMNDDALDQSVYQPGAAERAALAAAGYTGFPASGATAANTPFPFWRCLGNVLLGDEPAEKCNGLLNRTHSRQASYGISGQVTLAGQGNQFTAGAAFDRSRVDFTQSAQFGYLNPDHSVTPVDFFADGSEIDDDGTPVDARVDLLGRTRTASVYATDTLTLGTALHVTLSGRYNRTTVHNRDRITPGGGAGSLDGDHRFNRFNPAIGATWDAGSGLNVYAGYNEGTRAPTAVELGCADPENPCKLPNAMAGDPPLRQVVTKTWEAGLRGRLAGRTDWSAGVFRADNVDDILFVADNAAGFGYFRNVGRTRRQGIELGIEGKTGDIELSAHYTWLDATFRSAEVLNAQANSSADEDGNIEVEPGDRLPLIPRHLFKARAEWRIAPAWSVEAGLRASSGALARGNENGGHAPDGTYFVGSGRTAGYAVADLGTTFTPTPRLRFFVQVGNLFDRRYATSSQLNATGLTPDGHFIARPFAALGDNSSLVSSTFYAPGAPRTVWAGARYSF